ncbi:MAG TPA: hypothetical protein VNN76_03185 [Bacteroidota bacterium]|nr:hypothetical protein [Bacteroidota bacterium]
MPTNTGVRETKQENKNLPRRLRLDRNISRADCNLGLTMLLLVTHLAETLFPLVRCHLVALTLFATGHSILL